MSAVELLFLAAGGRVIIYLVQTLPPVREMKNEFFHELFNCDLCLGFWTYFVLLGVTNSHITLFYVPLISEVISAGIVTTLVHLVCLGWKLKHGSFEVD